jgi:hypothetical protein
MALPPEHTAFFTALSDLAKRFSAEIEISVTFWKAGKKAGEYVATKDVGVQMDVKYEVTEKV